MTAAFILCLRHQGRYLRGVVSAEPRRMSCYWEGKGFRQREQHGQKLRVSSSHGFQNQKQFSVVKTLRMKGNQ